MDFKKCIRLALSVLLFVTNLQAQDNTVNSVLTQTTKPAVGYLESSINPQYQGIEDNSVWHYIAVTKNGLNGKIYLDGNLLTESTYSNEPYIWNSLLLGATQACVNCSPVPDYFGQIDDLRISNIERPSTQISNYYLSNQPFTVDASTIGLYNFDFSNGMTLQNSGVGNNGTLNGGVNYVTGKFGQALSFDGVDDYARISQSLPTNVITIEFWFKSTDTNATMAMLEYAYNTGIYLQTFGTSCETISGTLSNGLVGYWPFCGNANDEAGNGYNGVVNGATLTTDRFGNSNSAYNFTGNSNNITLANSQNIVSGSFSVSAWCTIESLSPAYFDASLIGQFNGQLASERRWLFGYRSVSTQRGISYYLFNNSGDSPTTNFATLNWNTVQSNWYHIVWVFDAGNSIKTYLNGVLNSDVPISLANVNNSATSSLIKIGNAVDIDVVQNLPWQGKIDDIGIWNRVLNEQEISNLYDNNLTNDEFIVRRSSISIYPNPTTSDFYIEFNYQNNCIGSSVIVRNMLGQEIYTSPLSEDNQKISLSGYQKGIYVVTILSDKNEILDSKKIIIN